METLFCLVNTCIPVLFYISQFSSFKYNFSHVLHSFHFRCTSIYGTPTMFIDMLNDPDFDKFDFSCLRTGRERVFAYYSIFYL